jgi:hypothetical protein
MKTILVSFPEGIFNTILSLKGEMGESNSEIVRNIVIAYLSEQGFFSKMSIRGVAARKRGSTNEKK